MRGFCNRMKKFLSILLSLVLTASCFAVFALAAEGDIVYGDVDGDEYVSTNDARSVLRYAVNLEEFNEDQIIAADVNGDGSVGTADARQILRGAVGLENTALFGVNGSQVFMSGTYVLNAVIDEQSGTSFVVSRTENSTYLEATMEIDMSDGSTDTGKPVRIGFLTLGDKVYWVLPDASPICYLLIDDNVTANMGIDAELFKDLLPVGMTGMESRVPDEMTTVTINGKTYYRHIFENEDGTSIAHDMRGITLTHIRTFDAEGNETSVMKVNSISANVPDYQKKLVSGGILYAAKEGAAEDDIGYITEFLLKFAALANIPTEDIVG